MHLDHGLQHLLQVPVLFDVDVLIAGGGGPASTRRSRTNLASGMREEPS
jgi:hypothetical protein